MANDQSDRYFSPRRLGHVNLWVDNLSGSERFYNEICGLTVEFTEPDLVAAFLGTGHTPHDLGMIEVTRGVDRYGRNGLLQLPGAVGRSVGLNHLAWELENEAELVNAYKALKEDGIPTDLTADHQVAHSVYMFDPDGNYNEFYCDTVRDWRKVLHGPMDLLTSVWDPLAAPPFAEGRYDTAPELRVVDSAPIHPNRVTHAVLMTNNLPRLVNFYTRVAGLSVVAEAPGVVYLRAALPEYRYNLVLVASETIAYSHVAFELADEAALATALQSLRSRSASIERSIERSIELEVELPWKRSFFLRDPDGLLSEWYVTRDGARELDKVELPLAYAV